MRHNPVHNYLNFLYIHDFLDYVYSLQIFYHMYIFSLLLFFKLYIFIR